MRFSGRPISPMVLLAKGESGVRYAGPGPCAPMCAPVAGTGFAQSAKLLI